MPKFNDFIRIFFAKFPTLLLVLIVLAYALSVVNSTVADARHAYPREVIAYGLTAAKTDDEITATVEQWKQDKWSAQIGAMRVLCEGERAFVDQLGGANIDAKLCRTAQ